VSNILVVCTANQCRSPLAAALLRRALARRNLVHTVLSGGLLEGGEPSPELLVETGRLHGIDLSEHRSRQLSPELLDGADLVLCMTRLHVRDVAVLRPAVWPRAFTLLEFLRQADELAEGSERRPLADLVALAHEGRTTQSLLAADASEDVRDPMGRGREAFEELALILEGATDGVAVHL